MSRSALSPFLVPLLLILGAHLLWLGFIGGFRLLYDLIHYAGAVLLF